MVRLLCASGLEGEPVCSDVCACPLGWNGVEQTCGVIAADETADDGGQPCAHMCRDAEIPSSQPHRRADTPATVQPPFSHPHRGRERSLVGVQPASQPASQLDN